MLVTHDFAEAAHLGDEVAVMDRGQIVQRGTGRAPVAAPASAFVAEFAGASVLRGTARRRTRRPDRGRARRRRDGVSTDAAEGRTAATRVSLGGDARAAPAVAAHGSAQNRLAATVVSLTPVGNRLRVGPRHAPAAVGRGHRRAALAASGWRPGVDVEAHWKATATRLTPL